MEHLSRLELICRLLLGLFVGFFCVTAALFVRYNAANHVAHVLEPEERILITSSTSTFVTFIAALVANLLSWRKGKRTRRQKESGAPSARRSS